MGLVRQESFPNWEVSPVISLLSWEGSGVLGAGGGQPLGADAKHMDPDRYQRLSCGSYDSELQGGWILSSSGTVHPGAQSQPLASLWTVP